MLSGLMRCSNRPSGWRLINVVCATRRFLSTGVNRASACHYCLVLIPSRSAGLTAQSVHCVNLIKREVSVVSHQLLIRAMVQAENDIIPADPPTSIYDRIPRTWFQIARASYQNRARLSAQSPPAEVRLAYRLVCSHDKRKWWIVWHFCTASAWHRGWGGGSLCV